MVMTGMRGPRGEIFIPGRGVRLRGGLTGLTAGVNFTPGPEEGCVDCLEVTSGGGKLPFFPELFGRTWPC